MNSKPFGITWRIILLALLVLSGAGCTAYYRDGPPVYSSTYYHYPYRYHYYPSSSVYFHLYSGDYYYRDTHHWKRVKQLPPKYHLDRHDRVHLWIDADKPHARHHDHKNKYKPSTKYRRDTARDSEERRHNRRQHERYRNR
ncbi:MAG: hypothetical protein R3308_02260 [Thiohalobacterales bacterium]|nr:hypothetical protein [Thiohalobacterales bacterium]